MSSLQFDEFNFHQFLAIFAKILPHGNLLTRNIYNTIQRRLIELPEGLDYNDVYLL